MLGNGRCEETCIDGSKCLCHIRGKMHKKVWNAAGDIILVGLQDYQDDNADIVFKYMPDEARLLKAYGELPENIRLNEGIGGLDEEDEGGADDYIDRLKSASGNWEITYVYAVKIFSGGAVGVSYDYTTVVVDSLAEKKPLPEKGRFLEPVLQAGLSMKILRAAERNGRLLPPLPPQWTNPPPPMSGVDSLAMRKRLPK
ncbi:hypothetical protein ZIOFF_050148 [Zingiber officinale]|uniref:S1-like domain-containing protein n=1 Tax=Zingiber officinale TaxID=94328 RepID=A0A8J5FJT7_ZINOF|nr:hypothetical protein ZIOFF_050148 [Zingiber officinale]